MNHYLVYYGQREGTFSVNSRVEPGLKFRVRKEFPFKIGDGDLWIASIPGFEVLSTVSFVPTTKRVQGNDESYCSKYEGAFIEGLVANCPDPARVVEIGTGKGNSLIRILYGLSLHNDIQVWSIDLLECKDAQKLLTESQVPNWRYKIVRGVSSEMVDTVDDEIDFMYIDGSHSAEGVLADIAAWEEKVKSGGVMAFHDYDNPLHEVTEAIDTGMGDDWVKVGLVGTVIAFEKIDTGKAT